MARSQRAVDIGWGIEAARQFFGNAGLAFPDIPAELVARIEVRGDWLFSPRAIDATPYALDHWVAELDRR